MNVQHVSHVILQWNIMINPGISGSNCVGEKVRHLTTTLPQQVAADILKIVFFRAHVLEEEIRKDQDCSAEN